MEHCKEVFVGIDTSKLRNAIAVADGATGGEVRYYGEVDASADAMRRTIKRLTGEGVTARFCYEAGPTGYGLYRQITSLGHECAVVAPSLIPRRPGDRIKTDRRDALQLAQLFRAGALTPVWVPDPGHEAMRDLVRARIAAVATRRTHRLQVSSFLLKHGRTFPGKRTWGPAYHRWLQEQSFDHPAHQIALQELVEAARLAKERVERLEAAILSFLPTWSLGPTVEALQTLRGVDLAVAATFAAEIGDITRFDNPRQLMAYVGLVPSERSSGATIRRGGLTRAGNGRVRALLIEGAWSYRHPPRPGARKLAKLDAASPEVREIAWKAQTRLTSRYRVMQARGKKTTVVCAAIARELLGFMWAIGQVAHPR